MADTRKLPTKEPIGGQRKGLLGWEKSKPSVCVPLGGLWGSEAEPVAVLSRALAGDDASPASPCLCALKFQIPRRDSCLPSLQPGVC